MPFSRRSLLAALVLAPVLAPALPRALRAAEASGAVPEGLALIMFQQDGCPYCAAWNRDVAPAYAKTDEGHAAPLYRRDIHLPIPAGMQLVSPPQFTPTFVLLQGGKEVGRIEGYASADFFWAKLDELLAAAKSGPGAASKA